mmetsp:Transcript_51955/g.117032  ORF Transcript_51955/g.117032 Transcript_51955/m.117032 type:complete len:90 (+) Transcript_51955:187-456(+)
MCRICTWNDFLALQSYSGRRYNILCIVHLCIVKMLRSIQESPPGLKLTNRRITRSQRILLLCHIWQLLELLVHMLCQTIEHRAACWTAR